MSRSPSSFASTTSPGLRIAATPADHRPHFTHGDERIWPETNCYLDVWIELLHGLGLDPVPSFACALSADHDGLQWSFLKQTPEDLRRLYGLDTSEESVWMSVLETMEAGGVQGILHTVEVDAWWLPDTSATSYRSEHVKTTIVPTWLDSRAKRLRYLHNAGLFELDGDDFDGVFNLACDVPAVLPPYIERIRRRPRTMEADAVKTIVREHLARRPDGNPVDRLASGVLAAMDWLPQAGEDKFHRWAFATLRQAGATAELAADLAVHIDTMFDGAGQAEPHFRSVAANAKSVQFKMARVAHGKRANVDATLNEMSRSWHDAMGIVLDAAF